MIHGTPGVEAYRLCEVTEGRAVLIQRECLGPFAI